MLSIPSPNSDRSLLTLAQLRAAVGVENGSKDAALIDLGNYVAVLIAQACRVATAGGIPPTLRLETVVETIVLGTRSEWLDLARCPVTTINSVIENGTEIDFDRLSPGRQRQSTATPIRIIRGALAARLRHRRNVQRRMGDRTGRSRQSGHQIRAGGVESRLARSVVETGARGRRFRARILGRSHQGLGRSRRCDGHPRARRLRHAGVPMRGIPR